MTAVLDRPGPETTVVRYEPRGGAKQLWSNREPLVLCEGPAGSGKAQPLDALVQTPTGPRAMGDLTVGDFVLGADGYPAKVIDIPFRGHAPVWRLTFTGGETVECSDGHLWETNHGVLSTADILDSGLRDRRGRRQFWIPQPQPVQYDEQPVPVPAYTLGVLLGDGHTRPGSVSFTSADQQIVDRVQAEMGSRYRLTKKTKEGNRASQYSIVGNGWRQHGPTRAKAGYIGPTSSGKWQALLRVPDKPGRSRYLGSFDTRELALAAIADRADEAFSDAERTGEGIHVALRGLGLDNSRSASKFVPDAYKYNSADVRLAILQGLMDTDGYASRSSINFCSVSRRLAEDVQWLAESLGGVATITTRQPPNGQLAYQVWLRMPDPAMVFHLDRKRERAGVRRSPVRRYVEGAELVGERECQCITVSALDGLYLTERFVVTHNSLGGLWKLHLAATQLKLRGLMVRQTHLALTSTTLVTFEELVAAQALAMRQVTWFGGSSNKPPGYRYHTSGAFIAVGGLDKPSKFLSSEFDRIVVDEATEVTETAIEVLLGRLRGPGKTYKQIILLCNPDAPTHWINQRADSGAMPRILSRHQDNPKYYNKDGTLTEAGEDYIVGKLGKLTGVRRLRLLDGIWAAAEGIIYEEYDPAIHLVEKPTFHKDTRLCSAGMPWDWPRFWVIDFGYIHPFVLKRYAIDPDGRAWRYAEIYRTKRLVEDHAAQVMDEVSHEDVAAAGSVKRRVWTEPKPRKVICDHDAEGRATFEEKTGLTTTPAIKTVKDGIQKMQARLRVQPDGKPRFFYIQGARKHRDPDLAARAMPTCTEEEFGGYVWADSKTKEEPVKVGDDGMDTDRYLTCDLDRGQTKWMRWVA